MVPSHLSSEEETEGSLIWERGEVWKELGGMQGGETVFGM